MDALRASAVPRLLRDSSSGAVVLERIARGAGLTRWFVLRNTEDLEPLASRLSLGSAVSVYFDGRLSSGVYDVSVRSVLLQVAEMDGDAVIGRLSGGSIELDIEFVAGPEELDEYESALPADATAVYGRFPARDDDGARAVTINLPDRDGVARTHPH